MMTVLPSSLVYESNVKLYSIMCVLVVHSDTDTSDSMRFSKRKQELLNDTENTEL
jgi:hypothetical protein